MNLTKLRALVKGNRAAVTKLTSKLEDVDSEISADDIENVIHALEEKQKTIGNLHESIIETLPCENEEEIEEEVIAQHDYSYSLQCKINKFKKTLKVKSSNLNIAVETFTCRNNAAETQSSTGSTNIQPNTDAVSSNLYNAPQIQSTPTDIRSSLINIGASSSTNSSVFHRLPKLDLPTFTGNVLDWQAFWDSYESAIHTNPSLTNVQRFNYLKSLLRGESLQTIAGFALTNANYQEAVEILHERYGQRQKIIQTYMTALIDLPAPVNTFKSLRHFYDDTETYIRGLDSLGQTEHSYGSLLVPVMMQKLPAEVKKNITREHGSANWSLSDIRRSLRKELSIMEAGNDLPSSTPLATAAFVTNSAKYRNPRPSTTNYKNPSSHESKNHRPSISSKSANVCVFCKKSHYSTECNTVKECDRRYDIIKREKLCFNCLGNHRVAECQSKSNCKNCSRRHHTSLCKGKFENVQKQKPEPSPEVEKHNDGKNTAILHSSYVHTDGPVLLKTAIAEIQSTSTACEAHILFDEGAQRSFITEKLAKSIDLQVTGTETHYLSGFGETNRQVRHLNTAKIAIQTVNETIEIKVLIVPEIAVPLKTYQGAVHALPYLRGLTLAHPLGRGDMFEITLLIGADHYWEIIQDTVIRGNGPTAVKSKLGYLLSGPLNTCPDNSHHTSMMNVMASHISEEVDLEKFWKIESLGIETKEKDKIYDEYMSSYQSSSILYNKDEGKYYAKLPWKESHNPLPTNENISRRRTRNTISRLQREPELLKKYGDIIAEQERRGFIEKVQSEVSPPQKLHYIPHHPVKKDSTTTPIRIVYDCSCRSSQDSSSLNDCLQNTPPILNDLTSILLRFRAHQYAVTTDIEKAFLNVRLCEEDRDVTRFFWLSDPNDPSSDFQIYRFKSVLFGATCSPFILNAVIQKHLSSNQNLITQQLSRDLYVDNILSSLPDQDTLMNFYSSSRDMFKRAGFNLRSWNSNFKLIREIAKSENVADDSVATKVLGMIWNAEDDIITFAERKTNTHIIKPLTKRELLKDSASIYDPLGILSPLTVRCKILMQSLWKQKLDWDEPLPEDIVAEWQNIKTDIEEGVKTEIQRCYFSNNFNDPATLHVFTDSSMKAYGACAYLVNGSESSLVMAKNKVAPLKTLTIPKLELMAAVVGAKLASHVQRSIQCTKTIFWSDSQIILKWLSSTKQQNVFVTNRIRTIKELTANSEWRYCPTDANPSDLLSRGITSDKFKQNELWLHGPSWLVTGDFPTVMMSSLTRDTVPREKDTVPRERDTVPRERDTVPRAKDTVPRERDTVPKERDTVPRAKDTVPRARDTFPGARDTFPGVRDTSPGARDTFPGARDTSPGARDTFPRARDTCSRARDMPHRTTLQLTSGDNTHLPTTQLTITDTIGISSIAKVIDIEKFSSYHRLLNITAYVFRFIHNCRNTQKIHGPLTADEVNYALCTWIKDAQLSCYPQIFTKHEKILNKKSNLVRQLDLYIDENNIVRCGGRISNASMDTNRRFPLLLPTKHKLTELLIVSSHRKQLHCGTESLVTYLRHKFWIPQIRHRVKNITSKCIPCRKVTGRAYRVPDPPPLPKDRVQEGPPFSVTGVDFSGALNIRNTDGSTSKVYICLFTCAKTRAVHLEIVPNMTVDSFMLAFRRFTSRKSTPTVMMSDNALTYTTAAKLLKDQSQLSEKGLTWKFIPQQAPWYGGWWERLIGLTKACLKKTLGKTLVSLEILQTLITEVECIINDRPLTYVSSDRLDEDPLTPSHLIYGRRITTPALPDDNYNLASPPSFSRDSVKKLANFTSTTIQHFWERWKNEYLTSLRDYHKVHKRIPDTPRIGDVVLIHDENINRMKWPLAVIDELITGTDGFVRAARVRTSRGVTIRPIKKLYPLESTE